ncbi:MAG: aldo/keto reductase [Muribaculaceae bacterium]|nr:aldo/keto reductase [Muribaculaceae bacterium]
MKYNFCGHSGLQLPAISLGLWHNFGDVDCFATMEKTVRTAFDRGVTHFDLADNYGPPPGSAEENFARIMARGLGAHRDEILVSSKAGHLMWDGPYGDGGSRKHLMAGINQSLKRTGLEYFDIFYSHRYCPETPLEETVQALIDIVRQGKALYIGLSKYPVEVARRACRMMEEQHVRCLIYQDRYSLLVRKPEQEHLDFIREQGTGFITFSPLAQGLLTNRYLHGIPADSRAARSTGFLKREDVTPELIEKLRSLNTIAAGRGQSLAQMALAWLLAKPEVTSVLVGASSPEQLENNLKAGDNTVFSADELAEIDRILA